jgi:transposase InsO family protein
VPILLLCDRDASYGLEFHSRVEGMNITELITAPRSPWQNAYVERRIGSIRRECLDHLVIFNERHLRRVMSSYVDYYQHTRTHLSLDKDCPDSADSASPRRKSCRHSKSRLLASSLRTSCRLIRLGLLLTNRCAGCRTMSSEDLCLGGFFDLDQKTSRLWFRSQPTI